MRALAVGAACLAGRRGRGLAVSGLGTAAGARLLLNAGTADLNRATLLRDDRAPGAQRLRSTVPSTALRLAASLAPGDAADPAQPGARARRQRRAAPGPDRRRPREGVLASADGGASKADLLQLGRAYVATSTWGEAIRAWQAAEAAPQLIQLGNRLIRNRNFDQATSAFIATARVDPQSRGAYEGIARAARERKLTPDETIAELAPLLERGSPTELGARLQAARILREAGRLQDADPAPEPRRGDQRAAGALLRVRPGLAGGRRAGLGGAAADPLGDGPAVRAGHRLLVRAGAAGARAARRRPSRRSARASRRSTRPASSRRRPSGCPRRRPSAPSRSGAPSGRRCWASWARAWSGWAGPTRRCRSWTRRSPRCRRTGGWQEHGPARSPSRPAPRRACSRTRRSIEMAAGRSGRRSGWTRCPGRPACS